jgi:predicted DCC family thiol-disulfide oxidoreductase YuxK
MLAIPLIILLAPLVLILWIPLPPLVAIFYRMHEENRWKQNKQSSEEREVEKAQREAAKTKTAW